MNKTNKQVAIAVAAIVIVAGLSFFGGVKYASAKSVARVPGSTQFGMNRQGAQGMGGMNRTGGFARGGMGGAVAGEILSKDANGITVKLTDGGSRIVLIASSTQVSKFEQGTQADLSVGTNVFVNGPTNADGSVSAQIVQIRPAGMQVGGAATIQGR
jgi:hypothetical protein